MKAWSYTALTAFETCPRRYYHTRIAKDIVEPETEHTKWGNVVHEALEKNIVEDAPLPDSLKHLGPLMARLHESADKAQGELFAERKLCIDASFNPTSWFAGNAWCRGIVDAGIVNKQRVVAFDWKTGKPKDASDQLQLFAALLLHHYPEVKEVVTCFVWLAHDRTTTATLPRESLTLVWDNFLPRVRRLQIALEDTKFPPRPSGLCRKWCPVHTCEFHGK